jgi:hypothetical protein
LQKPASVGGFKEVQMNVRHPCQLHRCQVSDGNPEHRLKARQCGQTRMPEAKRTRAATSMMAFPSPAYFAARFCCNSQSYKSGLA